MRLGVVTFVTEAEKIYGPRPPHFLFVHDNNNIQRIYVLYIFKYNKLYNTHTHKFKYKLNETSRRPGRYDRNENDSRGNEVFCIWTESSGAAVSLYSSMIRWVLLYIIYTIHIHAYITEKVFRSLVYIIFYVVIGLAADVSPPWTKSPHTCIHI